MTTWTQNYTDHIRELRQTTSMLLLNSQLLAGFHYHEPAFPFYDVLAAERELRAAADELAKLAAKLVPVKHLVAAE